MTINYMFRKAGLDLDNLDIRFADGYAEPGYSSKLGVVILANWNNIPGKLFDLLERKGYGCEWQDEWIVCNSCQKTFRYSGDSYGWLMSGTITEVGDCLCADCVDPAEYLESLENNPRKANTIRNIDPAGHGYTKVNSDSYENGWYGQNNNPQAIYAALRAQDYKRVLFSVPCVGQFNIRFDVYVR